MLIPIDIVACPVSPVCQSAKSSNATQGSWNRRGSALGAGARGIPGAPARASLRQRALEADGDVPELDAAVFAKPCGGRLVDGQVEQDREARRRAVGQHCRAHRQFRLRCRRTDLGGAGHGVGDQTAKPGTGHPVRKLQRRLEVRPGTHHDWTRGPQSGRARGLGRRAGPPSGHRDQHQRCLGIPRGQCGLLALEKRFHLRVRGEPGQFGRAAPRQKLRLLDGTTDPRRHDVLADTAEQEKSAEQAETDDEQSRNEADENVGDDQLAAHPPQQMLTGDADEPREEVRKTDQQRQGAQAADNLDRAVGADDVSAEQRGKLDRTADKNGASRPGSHERVQNRVTSAGALGDGSPRRAGPKQPHEIWSVAKRLNDIVTT